VGDLPVLKPRRLSGFSNALSLSKSARKAPINAFAMLTDDRRRFRVHGSRDITPTLLRLICRDVRMASEEFLRFRD
jgi:hypothetical protein